MKLSKIFALSAVFACGLTLASCGQKPTAEPTAEPTAQPTTQPTVEPTVAPTVEASAKLSVGLGYAGSYAWKDTYGQLDLSAAFVAFDEAGKIVDARIDVVQVKVEVGTDGGLALKTSREDNTVATKLELGTAYNMLGSSAIGLEVDEQIENFADWTVGKTVAEVKDLVDPTKGHGVAHHPDLEATCTISCGDFVSALEMAYTLKTEAKYEASSVKAGIAMVAGLAYNYGQPKTDISVDLGGSIVANGTVVAAQVDAVVVPTTIADGVISVNAAQKYVAEDGSFKSKKVLGDAYAMAEHNGGQAGCALEWFEQAAIIEAAAEGKTAEAISALVKNEGDLAGATITLDSYVRAMATSAKYAEMTLVSPRA